MAEICVWPHVAEPQGARQLAHDLAQALADDIDLGPRGPHMRSLGLTILANVATLRIAMTAVEATLADEKTMSRVAREIGDALILIERSAQLACDYADLTSDVE